MSVRNYEVLNILDYVSVRIVNLLTYRTKTMSTTPKSFAGGRRIFHPILKRVFYFGNYRVLFGNLSFVYVKEFAARAAKIKSNSPFRRTSRIFSGYPLAEQMKNYVRNFIALFVKVFFTIRTMKMPQLAIHNTRYSRLFLYPSAVAMIECIHVIIYVTITTLVASIRSITTFCAGGVCHAFTIGMFTPLISTCS